jgi:hypothetical protein
MLRDHHTGHTVIAEYETTGIIMKRKSDMIHILVDATVNMAGTL